MKDFYIMFFIIFSYCDSQTIHSNDLYFRVEPGGRTCFFETGKSGDIMEVYYQVIDGHHGDLDISLDVTDPAGTTLHTDHKRTQNSVINELALGGDYEFCLDNTFSTFNSKLVYIYVLMEGQEDMQEAIVTTMDSDGNEVKQIETLSWVGTDIDGSPYYVTLDSIATSLTHTLKRVVKARQMLDMHGASKSRDSYIAFEGIFVVDLWSSLQITVMCIVGLVQVFMIKKLFKSPLPY